MSKYWVIIVLIIFVFNIQGQTDIKSEILNSPSDKCIDSLEFKIGNFYYGMAPKQVLKMIGYPDSIINEIDYNSETWIYSDIMFGISGDHVYSISTDSEKYETPSGIKIGMGISDLSKVLNIDLNELIDKNAIQIVNCDYEVYFIFEFNESRKLNKIEIGIDLP